MDKVMRWRSRYGLPFALSFLLGAMLTGLPAASRLSAPPVRAAVTLLLFAASAYLWQRWLNRRLRRLPVIPGARPQGGRRQGATRPAIGEVAANERR